MYEQEAIKEAFLCEDYQCLDLYCLVIGNILLPEREDSVRQSVCTYIYIRISREKLSLKIWTFTSRGGEKRKT